EREAVAHPHRIDDRGLVIAEEASPVAAGLPDPQPWGGAAPVPLPPRGRATAGRDKRLAPVGVAGDAPRHADLEALGGTVERDHLRHGVAYLGFPRARADEHAAVVEPPEVLHRGTAPVGQ